MLSNQFENIILEYKQDITAKKMGEPLIQRFMADADNDPSILTPKTKKLVDAIQNIELGPLFAKPDPDKPAPTEKELAKEKEKLAILKNQLAVSILTKIEETDPTKNKNYVQWLVRTYSNNTMPLEDVVSTIADYLDKFHKLKIKRHLKNADIGQYSNFDDFMNEIDTFPNDLIDDDEGKKKKYNAEKIYDENGILVIHPLDREASCRYGRGTRWCTASTRGHNYFDSYNRKGPLYMLIPRRPNHAGEKYQFHFEDGVVADEKDDYLNNAQLYKLAEDFPAIKDAFKEQAEKFGLLWLQQPKRTFDGSNFKVEEYVKNNAPYYLFKPTDTDQIFGMEKDADGSMKVTKITSTGYGHNEDLSTIEEHDLFTKYPDLVTKFGIEGANIVSNPTVTNTKNKASIEQHKNVIVMTDKHGHKTSVKATTGRDDAPRIEAMRTSPLPGTPGEGQRKKSSGAQLQLNPYELTLEHPELIDIYGTVIQKKIKEQAKVVKDNGGDIKEYNQNALRKTAAFLPYKLYKKEDVVIKSHQTSDGKPVLDYVVSTRDGTATIINRDMRTGEVDSVEPVKTNSIRGITGDAQLRSLVNAQGEEYGDMGDKSFQRLYSGNPSDHRNDQNALDFLPSISYLEQHPGLKDFYKETELATPKIKEVPSGTIKDYGKVQTPPNSNSYYSGNDLQNNVKSMRNYIVQPKDSEAGESYAISWSPERPQYTETYHSDSNGRQTKLEEYKDQQHVLRMFPELRQMQLKDWEAFRKRDPEYQPTEFSQYNSHSRLEGVPAWTFAPEAEVDNERVDIKQYGNSSETHTLPMFEVRPKEENPFGVVGDTFFIDLALKDNRGKYGKISSIDIQRFGKNYMQEKEVDEYGRFQDAGQQNFVAVDTKATADKTKLSPKEIIDFFKYYPELRKMVRDENIHPKTPHPALASKPDEEGNIEENVEQFDNFKLETTTQTVPGVEKQYIVPNEEEYTGEFYTLFTFDPSQQPAFENGESVFTEYGRVKGYGDRGFTQLVRGEGESDRSYYGQTKTPGHEMEEAYTGRIEGSMTPNTPAYNALMQRFPELKELLTEKGIEVGDIRTQNVTEEDVVEFGTDRLYTFKNKDGSDVYIITPVNNPLRGQHGDIKQSSLGPNDSGRMGNDIGANFRKLASDEEGYDEENETWNRDSYAINFESTESNPYLNVPLLIDPLKDIVELQVKASGGRETDTRLTSKEEFENDVIKSFSTISSLEDGSSNTNNNSYLSRAKQNPELYKWLQDKAEIRNSETKGIGQFINFLPITTDQLTDEQKEMPKVYGINLVGIGKIGISNPLYMWQGRQDGFGGAEYKLNDEKSQYSLQNSDYKEALNDMRGIENDQNNTFRKMNQYKMNNTTLLIKPESATRFLTINGGGGRRIASNGYMQVPNAKFLNMARELPNIEKIIPKKELKAMGAMPTQTWGPRQVTALAGKPALNNDGKSWIKSIKEFKMPDGLGIESHGYGMDMPHKILPAGTGYLITLNPISDQQKRKRVDGKIQRVASPWSTLMRGLRQRGIDLPWDFTHEVLDATNGPRDSKENQFMIYFANDRVAYILDSNSANYSKYNLTQEMKKALFFDPEVGIFPELKPIFDQYSKSNKWLREHEFHAIMSQVLRESLGDKKYWELQKEKNKQNKPNYGQLVFLKNIRLAGSYDNNKLKELGFFMKNGEWAISKPKYDSIVRDGKLREMTINRPLITGKNKIPNVGKKKVQENVWAFDAEKALELLKEPLLRGGGDDDPDLGCDMCGGHGCGAGYDIKDDLARWTEMLNPDADNRPEHLTNDYIQQKIEKLKAMVKKYPNGIPDNIDCSGGMSQQKHRKWESNKGHDAADVLYDVIGDDGFHDDLYGMGPDEDVRPLIMNWLNPSWRAEQRKGLPEYPAVADVDFAELYKRARQIYNPLTLVKEGKKFPRTSEFLQVKELAEIKRLAGVYEPYQTEGDESMGSNISKTASQISKIMKEKNIQPGTPEWFQLWFSKPYLTGEKPTGD